MTFRTIGFIAAFGLAVSLGPVLSSQDKVTDKIVEQMRKRQAVAKTVDAEIEQRSLLVMPLGVGRTPAQEGEAGLRPGKQAIILKDAKMFRRLNRVLWSGGEEVPEEMTSVFDGLVAGSLHVTAKSSVGFVHTKRQHADRYSLHVMPVVSHFRALADDMTVLSLDKWHVVATDAKLNDSICVLVREGNEVDVRYRELWFDAEKDYALVRRRDVFHGRTENELSITYKKDKAVGWVPSAWRVDRFADGRLIDHSDAKVVRLTINEPVGDATFELKFPPGATVNRPPPPRPNGKKQ
jgi:hypothetical protein